jgi:AcrR family transcriptional regulator
MGRVTKDKTERRKELIEAAEKLFIEQGYDQTAVSDIVKTVRVAQGTFYYHFASKADVLEAVVEKLIHRLHDEFHRISSRDDLEPAAKMNAIANSIIAVPASRPDLMEVLHQDSNVVLHDKMVKMTSDVLIPHVTEVLAQGAVSGQFHVTHPRETAEITAAALSYVLHQSDLWFDPARLERVRATLEDTLSRVLGTEAYRFQLDM